MKQYRIASTADKVARLGFREYLEYRMKPPFWNDTLFARLPDQSCFLTGHDGNICVKRLIQFENLQVKSEQLSRDLSSLEALAAS